MSCKIDGCSKLCVLSEKEPISFSLPPHKNSSSSSYDYDTTVKCINQPLICHANPANYHGNSELLSLSLFEYESPTHMLLDFYSEIFEFFTKVPSEKAESKQNN